ASIKRILRDGRRAGFSYVSCPEFLKEGSAVADFLHPDRVVIGDDGDWAGDAVARLYEPFAAPLVRTDMASAEMIKLASNGFWASRPSRTPMTCAGPLRSCSQRACAPRAPRFARTTRSPSRRPAS